MMADHGDTATHQTNCSYDVFLSFRGQDTRHSFAGFLYDALSRRGLKTFMDDEGLKGGDQISQALVNAIQESRISMVVFSENYAYSPWCLDELVEIVECMRLKNQLVWPIFYKVAPCDVRHQRNSFAEAMAAHEERFGSGSEKVQIWRSALSEVANMKGWHYTMGYEHEFIQEIAKNATTKLQREQLDIGEHIIGHQSCIEDVKSLIDIESYMVCMLGIHGIGGIGKTTLAKGVYNSIIHRFEFAIFLEGVRERSSSFMGLVHLQEAILYKLFERENFKLDSVCEGVTKLKDNLQYKRVLLVLDDVDSEDQLEKLAGKCNWFGPGSRIIITTRDKHVLDIHEVEKRYKMKGLNDHEALQLFCLKAFKTSQPAMDYIEVSNHIVHYASGLPLALKVIGSHLANKSVKECECAIKQYERIPQRNVQDILKISYDCLEDNAKHVFLDIACFLKGKSLQYAKKILEKCDFFPAYNLGILVDKSLLAIQNNCVWMHDLIQVMGKEIVRQEAPSKPGKRSRLCFYQDVLKVLRENSGSNNIEGVMLVPPQEDEVKWSGIAFEKMNNLRILIIRNTHFSQGPICLPNSLRLLEWEGYPSTSLPSDFYPIDIVDLSLPHSHLRLEKEKTFLKLLHLTRLNFSDCQFINHFPDVDGVPNLGELMLIHCENLTAIHHSVGFLKKLKYLHADRCFKLKVFLPRMWLPSLRYLGLRDTKVTFFPHIAERMYEPLEIDLRSDKIKELPDSISNLVGLKRIVVRSRSLSLGGLPSDLFMLPKIEQVVLRCHPKVGESFGRFLDSHGIATTSHSNLNKPRYSPLRKLTLGDYGLTDEDFHAILCCFPNLEELYVPYNGFVSLPASIKESAKLRILYLRGCMMLEEIPELPKSIQEVHTYGCMSLSSEASTILWSQALKEVHGLHVIMPKITKIPSWFDHCCIGGAVSFWARGKFPVVAVAFIFEKDATFGNIRLCINGCSSYHTFKSHTRRTEELVFLFDLRSLDGFEERPIYDTFGVSKWNHVEVECERHADYSNDVGRGSNISYCGVYVYKQETNMEDIRFTCPRSLKRTLSVVDNNTPKRTCG